MPDANLTPMLRSALTAIRGAVVGMTEEQMTWHPEGKWSAAEILEHLALAYSRTTDRIKLLGQQELPEMPRRALKEWIGGIIVLKFGYIPSGRKAPELLMPNGMSPTEAKRCIEEKLSRLDSAMEDCEKRFGDKTSVLVHSLLGPLTPAQWRRFHCVHTRHHVKQIRALRAALAIR